MKFAPTVKDTRTYILCSDPRVEEVNTAEAIRKYMIEGDGSDLVVPEGATKFTVRPLSFHESMMLENKLAQVVLAEGIEFDSVKGIEYYLLAMKKALKYLEDEDGDKVSYDEFESSLLGLPKSLSLSIIVEIGSRIVDLSRMTEDQKKA